MNKLTDRLQLIANQIEKGETMADIGTDHGFLPLYLWEEGICSHVIMCDISEASLAKAKGASGSFQFGKELEFKIGDGLQVLEPCEVDNVVIAGMGGLLIRNILSENIKKTISFKKYILQPRNNAAKLRYWLTSNKFDIKKNLLVREGKFVCEIIVANSPKTAEISDSSFLDDLPSENSLKWELPPEIKSFQNELYVEFAREKAKIDKKILEGLCKSEKAERSQIERYKDRLEYWRNIYEI